MVIIVQCMFLVVWSLPIYFISWWELKGCLIHCWVHFCSSVGTKQHKYLFCSGKSWSGQSLNSNQTSSLWLTCQALHYITLWYTTLHYTALYYTTLHCVTLHYIALLHYTTLHCVSLHYITLHWSNFECLQWQIIIFLLSDTQDWFIYFHCLWIFFFFFFTFSHLGLSYSGFIWRFMIFWRY